MRRYLPELVSVILIVFVGAWFWGTAVSTAWARLAALQTIEPYAFSVHEQLLYNFSQEGRFFQTIHKGYDDNWTWSGHRALTLPLTGWLYGQSPHPLWLAQIQLTTVLLGAIPAALLGRRAAGSGVGLAWGGLAYLLMPPTMALALQDYQDLIYALPFLVFAIWAAGSGKWWLGILGPIVAMAPREECIPMAVAIAILAPPWGKDGRPASKLWLLNVAAAVLLAVGYTVGAERLFPLAEGHDMPLSNALGTVLSGAPIFVEGWVAIDAFYALLWVPLGGLALLAPELVLPAVGLIAMHMTVPYGHGVDRTWGGHCHHMAPAAGFLFSAIAVGGGRLLRQARRLPLPGWGQQAAMAAVAAGLLGWTGSHWQSWADTYNLVVSWKAERPVWRHPAWALVHQLPDDAIPIASRQVSIAISNRRASYTFEESLMEKAPRQGLAAGTHLIVDTRREQVVNWGMSMPGAEVVAEATPFALITWPRGATDPYAGRRFTLSKGAEWVGPYRMASQIPGVPPHEPQRQPPPGTFPVLRLGDGPPPPPEPGILPGGGPGHRPPQQQR